MDISTIELVEDFEVVVSELNNVDNYEYENREYKELIASIESGDEEQILKNHVDDCINAIAKKYFIRGIRAGAALNDVLDEPIEWE